MGGKPEDILNISYYVVAFVDLLGQKEALKGVDRLPKNEDEKAAFVAALKKSAGIVTDLNQSLKSFLEGASRTSMNQDVPKPLRDMVEQMTKWKLKHQRFSDGLVLYASLNNEEHACPVVGVGTLLLLCSSLMLLSLAKGHPVRGGIDIGVGMELYADELYGPALAKAYELENRVAQYPRIVLGDTLIEYLVLGSKKSTSDPLVDSFWKQVSETCLTYVAEDTDGCWILDYLGPGVQESLRNGMTEDILSKVCDFVGEQGTKHRAEKNSKLVMRYLMLSAYLESKILQMAQKFSDKGTENNPPSAAKSE